MADQALELNRAMSASRSINPATDEEIRSYPHLTPAGVEDVLGAAERGFIAWRNTSLADRSAVLAEIAKVMDERAESLAHLITSEMGKPLKAAQAEVKKCVTLSQWYADNLERLLADERPEMGSDGDAVISYLPLGSVLGVMPWNFPLWQVLRAAIPILSGGNGFLLKHADNVQGSATALAEIFQAGGLPQGAFGVLNIHRSMLADIIADRRVAAVTVTAGVAAGAAVAGEAGRHLKKSVLELGGSDPFIVLADADLDRAVAAAIQARFQNSGQVCIAAKRIIIERGIEAEFTERFVAAARALKVGDPLEPSTDMGPLARRRLREELQDQVDRSIDLGATLLLGGKIPEGQGAYYPATVLSGVTREMPVYQEETFGPVASLIVADDAEDAIRIANDSHYGLSGALWTSDLDRAATIARQLETGGVFINGFSASDPRVPIGGIKKSGYGRELSHFGLKEFCNAQLTWRRD